MDTITHKDALRVRSTLPTVIPLSAEQAAAWMLAAFLLAGALLIPSQARAGQLIYEPRNPSFGGDPFNSSHLLSLSEKQNLHKEERSSATRNPGDNLVRRLESSISSAIARQAVEVILGESENAQDSGTIQFGDMQVNFERGLENLTLNILDLEAGTETVVTVPLLLVE